jgi:hypothetical protein
MSNLIDNFLIRLGVVILAIASPFICLLFHGELDSYSQYWETDLRPLFIFTNASTSYFLFSMKRWWPSALCLMILTAFSFDQYLWIHNISAIIFFLICGILIFKDRRHSWYSLPYFSSLIVLIYYGIFWAEVLAILVICSFHLHRMVRYHLIDIKRKKSII